ncbi:MAG: dihydrolipoyl dehydrogenase family protein [Alphaproteobacteria bacterium]
METRAVEDAAVLRPDLCVIGAGPGGLVVAAGAAQMGASVVLVERGRMGGDCLNTGCVPSKSTIAAARLAEAMRRAGPFGIDPVEPAVDYEAVQAHVRSVIEAIATHDSVERFEALGVRVVRGEARFAGPAVVIAGGVRIHARRFVIATGSSPAVPAVPGLADVPFLTSDDVFESRSRPDRLVVLGGGPIGVELAQAYRRLGCAVTLLEQGTILPREDPDAVAVVRAALTAEGVTIREGAAVRRIEAAPAGVRVIAAGGEVVEGTHLLVATGRRPNVEALGLDAAGVRFDARGIETDRRLRTSNRRIYAIGDVTGRAAFTHVAGHHAGIVIRNALFRLPARIEARAVPRVVFCDPELAQVGMDEREARAAGLEPVVSRAPFAENDRARADRATAGFVKVVSDRRGRVLGATIVGAAAGELILPWVLAVRDRMRLSSIAGAIVPYPTLSDASRAAAGTFYAPRLYGPAVRRLVRFLARFG